MMPKHLHIFDVTMYGLAPASNELSKDRAWIDEYVMEHVESTERRARECFIKAGFEPPKIPLSAPAIKSILMDGITFGLPEHKPQRSRRAEKAAQKALYAPTTASDFPWLESEVLIGCWLQLMACHNFRLVLADKAASLQSIVFVGMMLGEEELRRAILTTVEGERILEAVYRMESQEISGSAGQARIPKPDHSRLIQWARKQVRAGMATRLVARAAVEAGVSQLTVRQTRTVLQRAGILTPRNGN